MNCTDLTQDERYQIAILAKAGLGRSDIARVMERHKSTIGRGSSVIAENADTGRSSTWILTVPHAGR